MELTSYEKKLFKKYVKKISLYACKKEERSRIQRGNLEKYMYSRTFAHSLTWIGDARYNWTIMALEKLPLDLAASFYSINVTIKFLVDTLAEISLMKRR